MPAISPLTQSVFPKVTAKLEQHTALTAPHTPNSSELMQLALKYLEPSDNYKQAEKLIIGKSLEKQTQRKAPTAQTVAFARQELAAAQKPGFFKRKDTDYINQLQEFIKKAQEQAGTVILRAMLKHRADRKAGLKPELPTEQREAIREAVQTVRAQTRQIAQTGHIGYDTKLANGVRMDSVTLSPWMKKVMQDNKRAPHSRFNQETLLMDTQSWLVKKHLRETEAYLPADSPLHAALQQGAIQSPEQEQDALAQLITLTNLPFKKLESHDSTALSTQLKIQLNQNNPFVQQFGSIQPRLAKGSSSKGLQQKENDWGRLFNIVNPEISLGTKLEAGAGVCKERAPWLKVIVDHFGGEQGAKASLEHGSYKKKGAIIPQAHVWNQIKFPSGREYVVDPANMRYLDLSDPQVKKIYKPMS